MDNSWKQGDWYDGESRSSQWDGQNYYLEEHRPHRSRSPSRRPGRWRPGGSDRVPVPVKAPPPPPPPPPAREQSSTPPRRSESWSNARPEIRVISPERRTYRDVSLEGNARFRGQKGKSKQERPSYRTLQTDLSEEDRTGPMRPVVDFNKTINTVSQTDPNWAHVRRELQRRNMCCDVLSFCGFPQVEENTRSINAWIKVINDTFGPIFWGVHVCTTPTGYKYVQSKHDWVPGKTALCAQLGRNRTMLIDDRFDIIQEFRNAGGAAFQVEPRRSLWDAFRQMFDTYDQGNHLRGAIAAPLACSDGSPQPPDGCFECGSAHHKKRDCPARYERQRSEAADKRWR